jgi:hypothetical protein
MAGGPWLRNEDSSNKDQNLAARRAYISRLTGNMATRVRFTKRWGHLSIPHRRNCRNCASLLRRGRPKCKSLKMEN